jgi:hypothetical protein
MIQTRRSTDTDEIIYRLLLLFSIGFASLRVFMLVRGAIDPVAGMVVRIAGLLSGGGV